MAEIDGSVRQENALQEYEKRCEAFDRLPREVKLPVLEALKVGKEAASEVGSEVAVRAVERRRFRQVCRRYQHEGAKRFAEMPDRSEFIYALPDPTGAGWTAHRWGQPEPVGRGKSQIDAVLDLHDQEDESENKEKLDERTSTTP